MSRKFLGKMLSTCLFDREFHLITEIPLDDWEFDRITDIPLDHWKVA